jgi:hypothetical protein
MNHPTSLTIEEPCRSCGSWDITECEIRVAADAIHVSWECCDCGDVAGWVSPSSDLESRAPSRRLLSVMPLHVISTLYGENGLRERFAMETSEFGDPAERRRMKRALRLVGGLHAADCRQREPYVNHLLRVALRIACHYAVRDGDVICAALLHDAVDKHADKLSPLGRQGALDTLSGAFGARVANLVAAVTKPVYTPGLDQRTQHREHVAASLSTCPWARVIKVSDFLDGSAGLTVATESDVSELADMYAPIVPVLGDLIVRPDTPLSSAVKACILDQLRRAAERFAATNSMVAVTSEGW